MGHKFLRFSLLHKDFLNHPDAYFNVNMYIISVKGISPCKAIFGF
jgi:hypothetical protein